jgi:hypothetical protein
MTRRNVHHHRPPQEQSTVYHLASASVCAGKTLGLVRAPTPEIPGRLLPDRKSPPHPTKICTKCSSDWLTGQSKLKEKQSGSKVQDQSAGVVERAE